MDTSIAEVASDPESGEGSAVVAKPAAVSTLRRKTTESTRLFEPFRAIGFVCNHVPAVTVARGSAHFLTTAVGDAFHVYNVRALYSSRSPPPLPLSASSPRPRGTAGGQSLASSRYNFGVVPPYGVSR